jgi:hypothetical protein
MEVHVVLEMYKGVLCDVEVYKNDPDPSNKIADAYDREEDNGKRVFTLTLNEQ